MFVNKIICYRPAQEYQPVRQRTGGGLKIIVLRSSGRRLGKYFNILVEDISQDVMESSVGQDKIVT